jgi:hypothetical protein
MDAITNLTSYAYSFIPSMPVISSITATLGQQIGLTSDTSAIQQIKPKYDYKVPTEFSEKELQIFGAILTQKQNQIDENPAPATQTSYSTLHEAIEAASTITISLEVEVLKGFVTKQSNFSDILYAEMKKLPTNDNQEIKDTFIQTIYFSKQLTRQMNVFASEKSLSEKDITDFTKIFTSEDFKTYSENVKILEALENSVLHAPDYVISMQFLINAVGKETPAAKILTDAINTMKPQSSFLQRIWG